MGWISKGKILVPDGEVGTPIVKEDENEATTAGGIVIEKTRKPVEPTGDQKRFIRRLMKRMEKKAGKEANKAYLRDRYSYLRPSPKPKTKHTSGK